MAKKIYKDVEVSGWALLEASGHISLSVKYDATEGDRKVSSTEDIPGEQLMMAMFNAGLIDGWTKNSVFVKNSSLSVDATGLQISVNVELKDPPEFIKSLEREDILLILFESLNNQ